MRLGIHLFLALLLSAVGVSAQIWPEKWHTHERVAVKPAQPPDPGLWAEYAGEAAEGADYRGPAGRFSATAYRMRDATSALAMYYSLRPATAVPVRGAAAAAMTPGAQYMAHQNYVLVFEGWRPLDKEMAALYGLLPKMRSGGGLPKILDYLPEKNRLRGSERYILGLDSLARFQPEVPGSLAGFEDGVEGVKASYRTPAGPVSLLLLEYPTPQLARRYMSQFESRQGWAVKRSGPFIAIAPDAGKEAAGILKQISWEVHFTWSEATKFVTAQDVGSMMMAIFELAGFLLVVCLGGGLLFAGFWIYMRRRRIAIDGTDAEATFLRLD